MRGMSKNAVTFIKAYTAGTKKYAKGDTCTPSKNFRKILEEGGYIAGYEKEEPAALKADKKPTVKKTNTAK